MLEPTEDRRSESGTDSEGCEIGEFENPDKTWKFVRDVASVTPPSSGRKNIYYGDIHYSSNGKSRRACALVFAADATDKYGIECANLARMTEIGVGPKLLGMGMAKIVDGFKRPTIFEEHSGLSLANLLDGPADNPFGKQDILHRAGTKERGKENKKILFDVFSQLINAHGCGLYHRDLRCANVCVRRFGRNPEDIKATIIDFELGANTGGNNLEAAASLYNLLFRRIPTMLAGRETEVVPSPTELDLGYLAALHYQLLNGRLLLEPGCILSQQGDSILERADVSNGVLEDFVAFMNEAIDYFRFHPACVMFPFARTLSVEHDLAPYAAELGLVEVKEENFANVEIFREARNVHREYLDREDIAMVEESVAAKLEGVADKLVRVKFESYKRLRREQGKPVEYERVEDQPESLQRSNYAQAAHIPHKVHALGYDIVPLEEWEANPHGELVEEFTDEQVEFLARLEHERWNEERLSDGWKFGPRSHENKTSPYLVPYDELEDKTKEYDRIAVREVMPLLAEAGMVVVRRG